MPVTFRRARDGDVAPIVSMYEAPHVAGSLHVPDANRIAAWVGSATALAFVAERDGELAAFALALAHERWLVEIAQLVAARPGTGAGWFAVRETLRYAFERIAAHRVYLEVIATNDRARKLYEALAFTLEGTWRDGYRHDDGSFADLCAYGLLEAEYRRGSAPRNDARAT